MAHALHRSWRPLVVLGLLLCVDVGPVAAQATETPPLILRNVHMLEGPALNARLDVSIVVAEGRIQAIGPADMDGPVGAREIDLEGYWVVPGLIDAHSHLASLDAARRALESGVTTVRTAGVSGFVDVAIRDAVRSGALPGPDILAAGIYVTPRIGDAALDDPRLHRFLADDVDTEEELRALVALNAEYGADWIKTRGTERAGLPETDPREQVYTESQLRAVVEEAARHGLQVAAHAHGDEGIEAAVRAGVRSIEHGTYATDETLQLMRERDTWLVPTLSSVLSFGQPGDYADPRLFLRGQHLGPRRVDMVRRAHAMGIPIVVGVDTDYGPGSTARVSRAVTFMVGELGFDPTYALQGATSRAAELLGVADRTGALGEGMEADLIVIDSNPLERIRALQDPVAIVSNGYLVINRLPFRARQR
ncbi:MAG: amidohydrolase family protein [Gemmatimonadetes bacterium]|nr:amidohydrolase family protein [Gemmatimonadota bacterium]